MAGLTTLSFPVAANDSVSHLLPRRPSQVQFEYPWLTFQYEHSEGLVLNVGAGGDSARLKELRGAVNVDVCEVDPVSGYPNLIDRVADARALPFPDNSFDTVVLGEVLEHLDKDGARQAVAEARRVARERVVATIPCDPRSVEEQRQERECIYGADPEPLEYAPGAYTYHRMVTVTEIIELFGWVPPADLTLEQWRYNGRLQVGVVAPCS